MEIKLPPVSIATVDKVIESGALVSCFYLFR
jgi:hypothetical protein